MSEVIRATARAAIGKRQTWSGLLDPLISLENKKRRESFSSKAIIDTWTLAGLSPRAMSVLRSPSRARIERMGAQ